MRLPPLAVRTLRYDQAETINGLLAAIPDSVDLWKARADDLTPAYALWAALRHKTPDGRRGPLSGMGPTTTSKLMARKRPRLVPVVDSVVRNALDLGDDSWDELRDALQQQGLPEQIEALRPHGVTPTVSTLRLLDAAVWMRHSQGRGARAARRAVGLE